MEKKPLTLDRIRRLIEEEGASLLAGNRVEPNKIAVAGSTDGQALINNNGITAWGTISGSGVSDHGALTGLADDDHTQYHNDARGDARYWQLSTDLATQAELDAHLNDTTDAHDASAISIVDAAGDFTATDVEGALAELQSDAEADATALSDHISDATDAHAGTAITNTPAGTIAATTVQAAINELDSEKATTGSVSTVQTNLDAEAAARALRDVQITQAVDDLGADFEGHHHDERYWRLSTDLATQTELDTHKSSTDHDGRYYTETETNELIAAKTLKDVQLEQRVDDLTDDYEIHHHDGRYLSSASLGAYLTIAAAAANYQPLDADLTTIAGLTATTDSFMQAKAGAWASRTVAQVVADLVTGGLLTSATAASTYLPLAGGILTGDAIREGGSGTDRFFEARQTGDTNARIQVGVGASNTGSVRFGSGSTTYDWAMRRTAASEVTLDAGDIIKHDTPTLTDSSTTSATTAFVKGQKLHDFTLPTAAVPMNSQKLTGLGAGSVAGDSLRWEQLFTTSGLSLLGNTYIPGGYGITVGNWSGSNSLGQLWSNGLYLWVNGEANNRVSLLNDGSLLLGDGTAAQDVKLYRSAANELTLEAGDVFKHDTPAAGDNSTKSATTAYVDAHITDATDAHDASAISIVDAGAYFSGTEVEAALQEVGADIAALSAGSGIPGSTIDAKGDLIVGTADDAYTRLAVPSNTFGLVADSAQTTGWRGEQLATQQSLDDLRDEFEGDTRFLNRPATGAPSDGYVITSDIASQGGAKWLRPNPTGKMYKNGTQNINNITETKITAWTQDFEDDSAFVDVDTANNRVTAKVAGRYLVSCGVGFNPSAFGSRYLVARKNAGATAMFYVTAAAAPTAGIGTYLYGARILTLAANDYIEVYAYQSSGGVLAVAAGDDATALSMTYQRAS